MTIAESWDRILTWCAAEAPASAAAIRPPAGDDELRRAEETIGREFPSELREWYSLHDGSYDWPNAVIIPTSYVPVPTEHLVRVWARETAASAEAAKTDPDWDLEAAEHAAAGTTAGLFLPSSLPFAENNSGWCCFIDNRPGPRSGCITELVHGMGDTEGPVWDSLGHMLDDIASSLETGGELRAARPIVNDGALYWTYDIDR